MKNIYYRFVELTEVSFGYSDDEFDKLIRTYEGIFEKKPLGSGNNPSRAFAIRESISSEIEVTLKKIESYSSENEKYIRNEKEKCWELKTIA